MQNYKAFVHYQSNIVLLRQVLVKVKKFIKKLWQIGKASYFCRPKNLARSSIG